VASKKVAHGEAKFEYDTESGVLTHADGPGPKGGKLDVDYGYRVAGGLVVRTAVTSRHTDKDGITSRKLTLSNIKIDGQEIIR